MSRNIMLSLRFDGSAYHGWQLQKNAVSVQQKINEALDSVFHENANVIGCSRTDAGVHALRFCCNFHTRKTIPCEKIPDAVNAYLPRDISVFAAKETAPDFHARFSCVGKEYIYRILNARYRDPFYENRALMYPYQLDTELLGREISAFVGRHDFSAFCSAGSDVTDKVRKIRAADVVKDGDIITVRVSGDGFLYNMVRIIVGTLLYVNEGKIPAGSVPSVIESKDRDRAGFTAPAQGLYLSNVYYTEEEFL